MSGIALVVSVVLKIRSMLQPEKKSTLRRSNSAVVLPDGSREIIVPYRNEDHRVVIHPTRNVVFEAHRRLFLDKRGEQAAPVEGKAGVNKRFWKQFSALWSIICPRLFSKVSLLIGLNACFLIARTWLSLVVARLDGAIVRDLVGANGKGFTKGLVVWLFIALPASYTNSMIRYLQSKISIDFRTRLVRYVNDLYLNNKSVYYKVQIDGAIEGIDQFMTEDIGNFCETAATIYGNVGKPLIDLFVFNYQLANYVGLQGMTLILASYVLTASILRKISPAFGKLAAVSSKLEGTYRNAHGRLITNAEEIAFYNGAEREKGILERAYAALEQHIESVYKIRISYEMAEDYIIKYSWSAMGLICCSLPVFLPKLSAGSSGALSAVNDTQRQRDRTRAFIVNKRILLALAEAGARLMYSYKDLAELSGYTSRVYTLLSTLHRVHANAYTPPKGELFPAKYSLADVHGTVQEGYNGIRFENLPIIVPAPTGKSGEEIIHQLSLTIKDGEHTIFTGPNGCGKSAISRVVAGLWPVYRGLLSKPLQNSIFFIPQRPYLTVGSLRDQVIYPHTYVDMVAAGRDDEDIQKILVIVKLAYLRKREGGFDTQKNWKDVLSGGEKQRINLARLFYHRPTFAILDEATSAVTSDVEGSMYRSAKDFGITLVTFSHRPTLLKYHNAQVKIENKQWELQKIGSDTEKLSYDKEIATLEESLKDIERAKERRQEIEELLQPKKVH
ncbi:ATP-binding cassette long-chain fatty acid transporter pxa1 [Saitoella coloradoensis]